MAEEPVITFSDLLRSGYQARRDGRLEKAGRDFEAAADISRNAGRAVDLAQALVGLGQIARDASDNSTALRYYNEALEVYRAGGDALHVAHTVRHVADLHRHEGRTDEAERCYVEALQLYRSNVLTPPLDLANTLRGFAIVKQETGDRAHAAVLWKEAGELYATAGVEQGVAESARRVALLTSNELL